MESHREAKADRADECEGEGEVDGCVSTAVGFEAG